MLPSYGQHMTRTWLVGCVWLTVTSGVPSVWAQMETPGPLAATQTPATAPPAPPTYPTIRVSVLSYIQYDVEFKNRDGYNAFDLTRGYINVTGDLTSAISYRLTPDVRRITDGSLAGSLVLRVKYAFAQLKGPSEGSWVRFGDHQTPWIDFEEHIQRYRVQGTMFSEREGVIPGSGDFGVGYYSPLPSNYGDFQVGVYNGEGFSRNEATKHKSFQGRVSVRPLPTAGLAQGLRVHGFYDLGWYDRNQPRRHGIAMGSYENAHVVATAQWLTATERPLADLMQDVKRSGYSTFLEIREGVTGWAGLARVERFDPDTARANDHHRRLIAGAAYWMQPSKTTIGLVLTVEDVRYGSAADAQDEGRFLAQTHIEF
jgi:hypothetical protein